jgi:hypothetical protein
MNYLPGLVLNCNPPDGCFKIARITDVSCHQGLAYSVLIKKKILPFAAGSGGRDVE